jgi:hypothetical protein
MTGNSNFTSPKPSLADMQTALDQFSGALSIARSGSQYEKAIKNDKRQQLINLVHSLSNYVLFIADGDELIAQSSGYTIARAYSTSEDIAKATNLKLQDGQNAGELQFSFSKVKGAKSYMYQFTLDPLTNDSVWNSKPGTASKVLLKQLESRVRYWCRVVAIGVREQTVVSDAVARVVQ